MINQELKVGDRVMLLHMDGEEIMPGTWGTVTRVTSPYGITTYNVTWDSGTKDTVGKQISNLALLSDADSWTTHENVRSVRKKKLDENLDSEWNKNLSLIKNIKAFEFFDIIFLRKYLMKLKDSGIVNMFESPRFLYLGKNRIEHEFKYKNIPNKEAFDELLEMADESQAIMINGVIKLLENEDKESSMELINSYLKKYSTKVFEVFVNLF